MRLSSILLLLLLSPPLSAADRPNVVIVLCDDLRWDTLSCAGHPDVKTPNIDRLAKEGVHFVNTFCTTSLCSPSRASILSGQYAHSHGVVDNFTEYPTDLESLPRNLQTAGYATAYIGKYHMGEENDQPRPGFDWFVTHKGQGKYFDTEFNLNGKERKVIPGYYTHVVTDLALDWLNKQSKDKPFFLMLGQKAPHSFYTPEEKYAHTFDNVDIPYPPSAFELDDNPDWYKTRLTTWHGIYGPLFDYREQFPDTRPESVKHFAAMIRGYWGTVLSVDDSVGRLYSALKDAGQIDNTIFVFMGDNGLLNGEHGMVDKRTMHEPSIRIPLVVRLPKSAQVSTPRKETAQVLTLDLAPSLLELCGAAPLTKAHGRSWVPLVQGKTKAWRTGWLYEYNYEKQFPYTPNIRGVRTDEWKLIRYPHGDGGPDRHLAELYNIKNDPEERKNLIKDPAQKARIAELSAMIDSELRRTGAIPDKMPIDAGIKQELPDLKIR